MPRRYWRLSQSDSYVVWQVLPQDSQFCLLGEEGPPVRDRYAELAVAADVHGEFPVVRAAELATQLEQHPGTVVARSLVDGDGEVWHVLATRLELAKIALTESSVHPEHAEKVEVLPGLLALGYDLRESSVGGRRRLAVTIFWMRAGDVTFEPTWLRVRADGDEAAVSFDDAAILPKAEWPVGRVVPQTVCIDPVGQGDLRIGIAGASLTDQVRWFTR